MRVRWEVGFGMVYRVIEGRELVSHPPRAPREKRAWSAAAGSAPSDTQASENRAKRRGAQQRRVDPVILHEPPDPLDDVTVREAHETAKPPLARSGVATVNLFSKYLFCLKKLLYVFA